MTLTLEIEISFPFSILILLYLVVDFFLIDCFFHSQSTVIALCAIVLRCVNTEESSVPLFFIESSSVIMRNSIVDILKLSTTLFIKTFVRRHLLSFMMFSKIQFIVLPHLLELLFAFSFRVFSHLVHSHCKEFLLWCKCCNISVCFIS